MKTTRTPNNRKKNQSFLEKYKKYLIGGAAFVVLALFFAQAFITRFGDSGGMSERHIGLLRIEGIIFNSEDLITDIQDFQDDESTLGVIVKVNSPGGGLVASDEIYHALRKLREEKPVYVSMDAVAASGGVYVAMGGSKIYANQGTITGSIGVIVESMQYVELMKKIGIGTESITSGKYKDIGNPNRLMTDGDRAIFQSIVDEGYEQFLQIILDNRDIPEELLRPIADGRIMTGAQAHKHGLVDEIGGFEDVLAALQEELGEPDIPLFEFIEDVEESFLERLIWDLIGATLGENSTLLRFLEHENQRSAYPSHALMAIMPAAL